MLFKQSCKRMGIVVREPTPIKVPKDLKCPIAKDRKEVAAIDDAQEAAAFNIDGKGYMELSAKPLQNSLKGQEDEDTKISLLGQ